MIKIVFKKKEYFIEKDKIMFILSKLHDEKIAENMIIDLMKKYQLFDEDFLENINKI